MTERVERGKRATKMGMTKYNNVSDVLVKQK
jgi:hypothetical protein